MTDTPGTLPGFSHEDMLSVLARANADRLKGFAENLIAPLGDVDVVHSRTGLVMLPFRDTARGTAFHLGETLVSEAHIRAHGHEGYGMRRGRDLEASMAMALVDLAIATGAEPQACADFIAQEQATQVAEDNAVMCRVEATRVDMETF